jgi:hypothetical protein
MDTDTDTNMDTEKDIDIARKRTKPLGIDRGWHFTRYIDKATLRFCVIA